MGKKSSEAADVRGAAQLEGEFGIRQAQNEMFANRPDQFNYLGGVQWTPTYETDPTTGEQVTRWTQEQSLSPAAAAAVNPMMEQIAGRSQMANALNDRIYDEMSGTPDWQQFGDYQDFNFDDSNRQDIEDAYYQKEANRLDPQFAQEAEQMEINLRSKGLRPGDQVYDSTMASFGNTKTDAYEQARLGSILGGAEESDRSYQQQFDSVQQANELRDKRIAEYIGKRGFSLGEQDSLSGLNDLNTLAGLITGQGLGGKTDSGSGE